MASITVDNKGKRRILFTGVGGVRRTLYLGRMSSKQAQGVKVRVEQLATATVTKILDPEAAAWVGGLDEGMHAKLARLGLVPPKHQVTPTLGRLLDAFFETLAVKSGTRVVYQQTGKALEDHFGKGRLLSTITTLDADRWRQSMRDDALADATISKRVKTARQIFKQGIRWKMLASNPLEGVKAGAQTNKSRMYFISREDAARVLDACPDAEWRLLFALSRYGGLRCPSEHLRLKWTDVDWARGLLLIRSPKTEAYENGDCRFIPLFPGLKRYLLEVFELAAPGAEYAITRYRQSNCNLRSQLFRIITREGVKPWPKLFHNLRSTRQTELNERFPNHVVCAWLGNSEAVAKAHYLQITPDHFERALREGPDQRDAKYDAASSRTDSHRRTRSAATPELGGACADPCEMVRYRAY